MIGRHKDPGPRGFAVYSDDGTLLADRLTQQRAFRMLLNGRPEPKVRGRRMTSAFAGMEMSGIVLSSRQVRRHASRHKRAWFAHNQGQGSRQYADE